MLSDDILGIIIVLSPDKMKIPSEILRQLHEMNCEDVAKRFGVDVKGHMAHCFKHDDRIASLSFRRNHWRCFSCDIGGDAITFIQ